MTLSAYLGLLSIGSTIQTRSVVDNQEEEEREVQRIRLLSEAIANAEVDIVSTVSTHHAPLEHKGIHTLCVLFVVCLHILRNWLIEVKENISGVVLAIGSMVANYTLCFPIVAARHSLQALPVKNSFERDTPRYGAMKLYYTYKYGGIRRLYPGFGLGLLGQSISASYESIIGQITSSLTTKQTNFLLYAATKAVGKLLTLLMNVPLYPLYRNALILRIQSDSSISRVIIRDRHDFIRAYKQNLSDFHSLHTVPIGFLPSCILNILTENLLVYIYKYSFKLFMEESKRSDTAKKEATVLHTFYPEIACGVVSSIITRTLSYPMDTILFKLMVQDSGVLKVNTHYSGFFDCVRKTYAEGGWKAFYPGWGIGLLEITMGYFVLEASWLAYRLTYWCLSSNHDDDQNMRTVKKARKLQERLL